VGGVGRPCTLAPLHHCLQKANTTTLEHSDALALYFRYNVENDQECNLETRIIRGCVANDTRVIRFVRYPPGPLR